MNIPQNISLRDEVSKPNFLRQNELIEKVQGYDPLVDVALLNKAYVFSVQAHGNQKRHSGDPYYAHPIEVAGIVAALHLDVTTVCAALLHDVLEDTDTDNAQLTALFSPEIAELVDGVTKLGELVPKNLSKKELEAENFQKFMLAVSKDVRVLLVKLCDRLHNMRTLHYHPKPASRERIAAETLEIYAPLARRIGVERICSELEDLAFRHLYASAYESITKRLEDWRQKQKVALWEISVSLGDLMDEASIAHRIYGREKRPFAIWKKLQRQSISFDGVADIYAFRIIVQSQQDCYKTLGVLHSHFQCVPSRFRDFISIPKSNGYQSLHTTVLGPENCRIEVQIRTERMEDVAERGVAAHWAYKNQTYAYDPESAGGRGSDLLARIRSFVEMMEYTGNAAEFLEHAKMEMFADQVFTFTPRGKLIALPSGASSLDFAYALHSEIGDKCIGAIINGHNVPLRTQLNNGDVVEIIRGGTAEPQPGWENIVVTGRARSALRRLTRINEKTEFRNSGKNIARHAFYREDKAFDESALTDALKRLNFSSVEALYEALGQASLSITDFMNGVFPGRKHRPELTDMTHRDLIEDHSARLYIKGPQLTSKMQLHLAECCAPISGDRIVGLRMDGEKVTIHTIDCDELLQYEDEQTRWLDLGWRKASTHSVSTARLLMTIMHVPGALADITKLIGEAGGNVAHIETLHRHNSFFDMGMDLEVQDNRHLLQVIAAVRTSIYVVNVARKRGKNTL